VARLRARSEFEFDQAQFGDVSAESVAQALGQLPERYICILEWKYSDELTVEEISQQLGLTVSATYSLLARARQAFRDAWRGETVGASHDF
jgi:DNA-directed RNA polymerase specialized sigma24 family protein